MKNTIILVLLFSSLGIWATDINVNGYTVKQFDAAHIFTLPDTVIHEGEFIIIARDCSQADFETFWNVTLGSNVIYFNSGNTVPMINGDESFALYDSTGNLLDSTDIVMPAGENKAIIRDSTNVNTWAILGSDQATPGSVTGDGHNAGLIITEFTDSTGTGNYIYEYVELYNDPEITGIKSSEGSEEVNCYYNYIRQGIVIEHAAGSEVQVMDAAGRVLTSSNIGGQSFFMSLANIPHGVYFIHLKTSDTAFTDKIIKI